MTEYELVDITGTTATTGLAGISLYLSVVSAYLFVAFSAGAMLTRSQTFIVSILFIAAASLFTYVAVANVLRQTYFLERLAEIETDATLFFSERSAAILAIVMILGIFASLKFIWDVRHPKTE